LKNTSFLSIYTNYYYLTWFTWLYGSTSCWTIDFQRNI